MNIDANYALDVLAMKVGELTKENAVLKAQIEQLKKEIENYKSDEE